MMKVTDMNTVEITIDRKGLDIILEAAIEQIEPLCEVSLAGMTVHRLSSFDGKDPDQDGDLLNLETGELTITFRRYNELMNEVMS